MRSQRMNWRRPQAIPRNIGLIALGVLVFVWTITPIYNMIAVALESGNAIFTNRVFPAHPLLTNFLTVFTQNYWYLKHFWIQLGNSLFIGLLTAVIVILVGSLASFAIGRVIPRSGTVLSTFALVTYLIPMSFLAIPFYKIMHSYGLSDHLWAVVLVEVTFATPYAIFMFRQYGNSIPKSLDESAEIDGASLPRIYFSIYLPLMTPALVAVGTYALLLAWNEYLYAFLLLSSATKVTVPVALGFFLNSDESPWNLLMAAAIVYSLAPAIIYYLFKGYMSTGLTVGGVKG